MKLLYSILLVSLLLVHSTGDQPQSSRVCREAAEHQTCLDRCCGWCFPNSQCYDLVSQDCSEQLEFESQKCQGKLMEEVSVKFLIILTLMILVGGLFACYVVVIVITWCCRI